MIYIMGGTGFVGSAFTRLCLEREIQYEILTRENYDSFIGKTCDVFVYANGNSKKFLADREALSDFDASIKTVCASLHDFKFSKYVLCSSCDVYADYSHPANNSETAAIEAGKISRYGFHKHVAEQFVRYEADNYLIFRFGGFVGPGLKKNAIFDILNGGPLWLDTESELQFLHIDVAADRVWRLMENGIANETINLCGNGLVKLREVIARVGCEVPVERNSPKVIYNINIEKALEYFPLPSTRDTVFKFVDDWLKKHGKTHG
ncbi:MAG TPA: NAD-dependent epimerase/dehydratase family protein [Thermodesulfovibrionales bacterium]|nr:NAD-dependent epimerase/dehydratase family protein [Thermodesulfovibrionales bacterium]